MFETGGKYSKRAVDVRKRQRMFKLGSRCSKRIVDVQNG